jgi:hypothetical protein
MAVVDISPERHPAPMLNDHAQYLAQVQAPDETNTLQWSIDTEATDVPLLTHPTNLVVGSGLLIDAEYMVVTDVSNLDNPEVERAAFGSTLAVHIAGAAILIYLP